MKVLDFGLVRRHSAIEPEERAGNLSKMGTVIGTPAYMAPELIHGSPADARSDIYAVGCVAYWLACGVAAFEAPTVAALLVAHASAEPLPPSQRCDATIPADLESLILDCLEKDPDDRIRSVEEIAARLDRVPLADTWSQERAERWWVEAMTTSSGEGPKEV